MALVYSTMLELGVKIPEFKLVNSVDGKEFDSRSFSQNKGKIVMFISNHCPYVIHYHDEIVNLTKKYHEKIEFVAISSNDVVSYPQDGVQKMKELAKDLGFNFPYLYDETQEIAREFKAQCTPEFYFFDGGDRLIYRGRLDDSNPSNGKNPSGADLRNAIDDFLCGRDISKEQFPSMGCSIKWK